MGQKNCRTYVDLMNVHDGVSGSTNLCVVSFPDGEKVNFLVDCGLFLGDDEKNGNNLKIPFNPTNLSFVLVTHAHIDHIGRLPLLAQKGYTGKIYATETTCKIMPSALQDSTKISKNLYTLSDVEIILWNSEPCKYNEPIKSTIKDY